MKAFELLASMRELSEETNLDNFAIFMSPMGNISPLPSPNYWALISKNAFLGNSHGSHLIILSLKLLPLSVYYYC